MRSLVLRFTVLVALTVVAGCEAVVSFTVPRETGAQCNDGLDNDGNGLIDCADSTCVGDPVCLGCGNGLSDPGEQCDDGNLIPGDGCSPGCTVETAARCGDGKLDAGEQCDDGNADDTDGCLATCKAARCAIMSMP